MCFRRTSQLSILLALCSLQIGCGSSEYEGKERVSVAGKVTFKGELVDGGSIYFVPTDINHRKAGAVVEQGQYTIPEISGPNIGEYRVQLSWPKPTGEKVPAESEDGEASKEMVDVYKETIPREFNLLSTRKVTFAAGENTQNIDIP